LQPRNVPHYKASIYQIAFRMFHCVRAVRDGHDHGTVMSMISIVCDFNTDSSNERWNARLALPKLTSAT